MQTVRSLKDVKKLMKGVQTYEEFAIAEDLGQDQCEELVESIKKTKGLYVDKYDPDSVPRTITVGH